MINRSASYFVMLMAAVCHFKFVTAKWPGWSGSLQHDAMLFGSLFLLAIPVLFFIGITVNFIGKRQKDRSRDSNRMEVRQMLLCWDLSARFLSFFTALTIATPIIEWLTSHMTDHSAPWWAAQIALHAQCVVAWVLVNTGLVALFRMDRPAQSHTPLWRGAVCDLAIAGGYFSVGASTFITGRLNAMPGGELAVFFMFELAALAVFLMIRDLRAFRPTHDSIRTRSAAEPRWHATGHA